MRGINYFCWRGQLRFISSKVIYGCLKFGERNEHQLVDHMDLSE